MAAKTILLVDDDPDFVEATRVVLEGSGYRMVQVASGREALARMGALRPDLIILDVVMESETAGFEMAYRLRNPPPGASYASCSDVSILVLTGLAGTRQMSFDPSTNVGFLPIDAYLEKPVPPDLLLARVQQLLGSVDEPS